MIQSNKARTALSVCWNQLISGQN